VDGRPIRAGKEIPVDRIKPHLWFDSEAVAAGEFYSSTFPSSRVSDVSTLHDTPRGGAHAARLISFQRALWVDRFGVSWQVVPSILGELLGSGTAEQTARVTEAFLQMKKVDIAGLKSAYEGVEARAGGER
jgi:predicted 3-demethylubiquinone-9 3-methyltransferase (glyoxalase superfamily)